MNKKITDMSVEELSDELDRLNLLISDVNSKHLTQLLARKSVVIDELELINKLINPNVSG